MANTKKKINPADLILFSFFVLFPFGQIIRLNINILGTNIPVHPLDLVVLLSILTFPRWGKALTGLIWFILAALFSYLFSWTFLSTSQLLPGGLYLARLGAYVLLSALAWQFAEKGKKAKELLLNCLLLAIFFVGLSGWIQYFWFPDLRALTVFGWDDHLNRLTGTFLDPGFTGIILVVGFLISAEKYLAGRGRSYGLLAAFFAVTTAFTYSRASFAALLVGAISLLITAGKQKLVKFLVLFVFLGIVLLPRLPGEGTNLLRTASSLARINSVREVLPIISRYPLFGVGYNNLCASRNNFPLTGTYGEHSCSGTDNSFVFVLVTTGLTGFLLFVTALWYLYQDTRDDLYGRIFKAAGLAVLVHSLFTNTIFYPWVMGILAILLGISRRVGDRKI